MEVYEPGMEGDLPLLRWWAELHETGDIGDLVGPSLFPFAAFARHFTEPGCRLFFLSDETGWYAVAWVFPMMSGGTWGLWVRNDKRPSGSRSILKFIIETLDESFKLYPVLVNICKTDENARKTKALGYNYLCKVPYIFDGEDAHFLAMTKLEFESRSQKWRKLYGRR